MWVTPIVIIVAACLLWWWIERRLRDPKGLKANIIFAVIVLGALWLAWYMTIPSGTSAPHWKIPASPHPVEYYRTPLK
jgi:uncharacterized membrane protein